MISRGSEWRRWNLHLHSKYSLESRTKMEISQIFESAVNNEMALISITDHSNVDALDEIWDVYEHGSCSKGKYNELIDFLPGIEVKTNEGRHGVHLISIFPKEILVGGLKKKTTKTVLYDEFCTNIGLTKSKIEASGNGDYSKGVLCTSVDLDDVVKLTHELGGVVIVHGGDKHGSIEKEMEHTHKSHPTAEEMYENLDIRKEEIISKKIDVVELPNFNRQEAKNAKFYMECMGKPCIIASDSHEKSEYDIMSERSTWIKADTTFNGFLQALIDYENRICLADKPEQLERIIKNSTKYIDQVNIEWKDGYTGEKGVWFNDINIPLNPGLVSIIGNKGNGKSALAEIIASVSDSRNYSKFAFLTSKKFMKNRLANNFICRIKWCNSNEYLERNVGETPITSNVEKVQCIPQQYFEEICTDTELEKFTSEINGVIFSRLNSEENEGELSLEALIDKYSKTVETNIAYYISDLTTVNKKIIELEQKKLPKYESEHLSLFKNAKSQLEAHFQICPKKIEKPQLSNELQECYEKTLAEINALKESISITGKEVVDLSKKSSDIGLALTEISEFSKRVQMEKKKISSSIQCYDIDIDQVISLKIDTSSLEKKKEEIDNYLKDKKDKINNATKGEKKQLSDKEKFKESILVEENKNIKRYDKYVKDMQEWEEEKNNKEQSVKNAEKELNYIKAGIQNDLETLYKERKDISQRIYSEKRKIIDIYNRFKKPVDEFLEDNKELLKKYSISIRSGLVFSEMFQNDLLFFINKQKKNAFRDDEYQLNKTIEEMNDIESTDNYTDVPELIISCMRNYNTDIEGQLKDNKCLEFYNYLYGLSYVKNKYELISDNKTLDKLSPGERGALLLIFYLLLDLRDIPLIIDQPEDNLDNQSVAKVLVPFIKEAKKRRQIVLVTHNPNLAVVADSDQVIHIKIDKEHGQEVVVESGSIENPDINKCIVTILEGTMESFRKRDDKYIYKKA